jgi:hypothetical protein
MHRAKPPPEFLDLLRPRRGPLAEVSEAPMTEEEWLACDNPTKMLTFLKDEKIPARTLVLFFAGCTRRHAHLITDPRLLRALDVAERFLFQEANERQLAYADRKAHQTARSYLGGIPGNVVPDAVDRVISDARRGTCLTGVDLDFQTRDLARVAAATTGAEENDPQWKAAWTQERVAQANLFRDVLGNPFRPAPPKRIMPVFRNKLRSWREANNGLVAKLARAIHEERRYADLPILGDALEDAGCTNADMLAHCRQPTEHIRGCWVMELLRLE